MKHEGGQQNADKWPAARQIRAVTLTRPDEGAGDPRQGRMLLSRSGGLTRRCRFGSISREIKSDPCPFAENALRHPLREKLRTPVVPAIGNGWFGGMLALLTTAIVAYTGNIYDGLWYPISISVMTVIVGGLFLRETKDIDITTASAVEISRRV